MGGSLKVVNSNFTDNQAIFDGGAIYTSNANVVIINSTFNKNFALFGGVARGSYGGAIFCDKGMFSLGNSILTQNYATYGGAIYLFDSGYYIEETTFSKNSDDDKYSDIYTVFDGETAFLDNSTNVYSSADSVSQNNTNYATIVSYEGMKLSLINNTPDVSEIPTRFDLRDWGWVTSVKNQGRMGACWTFGSSGAMESAILRYLGLEVDLSENNMQDVSLMYYMYGINGVIEGSYIDVPAQYALSWLGVFDSEYDVYDELGKISPIFATSSSIHFQDAVRLPPRQNATDNNILKEAILKYGGLFINYYATGSGVEQYYNGTPNINHGVTLIGWDDDRQVEGAPGKGAWIIKNSWGEAAGENGYMYVSYYDTSLSTISLSYAFPLENTVIYNRNYQYDIEGMIQFYENATEYRNNYASFGDDLIAAVGTYFSDRGVEYVIEIYINEELKLTQEGVSPFGGFHTIKLDSYVPIKKGDLFSVKIKSNFVPVLSNSRQYYIKSASQYLVDGVWMNISDERAVCSIKAYTVADDSKIVNNQNITVDHDGESYFTVTVVTDDEYRVVSGALVNFTVNGKTTTAVSDENGTAKINISGLSDDCVITTTYNGKTYENTIHVVYSFADLESEIETATDSFDITKDYRFNNATDNAELGIVVKKDNFVINGNGHTLDGDFQSRIFLISGKNITINNLRIIKGIAADSGVVAIINAAITTNNVTFEYNYCPDCAPVGIYEGEYTSINDKFINNVGKSAAIYATAAAVNVINGTFINDYLMSWGMIYLEDCLALIENTTFAELYSSYSSAIYMGASKGKIRNCDFVNLTATSTAGAIGIKSLTDEIVIENCNFIGDKSLHNGGAIFADVAGIDGNGDGNIIIINSSFVDCFSAFGGAVLQLGGHLNVVESNFTSNNVYCSGGAIYTSAANVNVSSSSFISNVASDSGISLGGACYFDNGNITLNSCIFKDNVADYNGSSILAYDCALTFLDNYFNNPATGGVSIYTIFDRNSVEGNFSKDVVSLNNTDYAYSTFNPALPLVLINNTITVKDLPSRFDLRDWGWVSPVKDQGDAGACWTFGSIGALESSLIRYANVTYAFSENNLRNIMLKYSPYGSDSAEGGAAQLALGYFVSWLGAVSYAEENYDQLGKVSPLISNDENVAIINVAFIPPRQNSTDNNPLKEAIIKYGSLVVNYFDDHENPQYYNETTHAYYFNGTGHNHVVSVVGWDDNYPKENFAMDPGMNGAWICKNSWGTEFGEEGYFYISYYDKSFVTTESAMAFIINSVKYEMVWQLETCWEGMANYTYYMNKMESDRDTLIEAVGTYFNSSGIDYEFSVLVNGVEVHTQKGVSEFMGYSTIELNKYVPIKKDDNLTVIFKNNSTLLSSARHHAAPNSSFASYDGVNWIELSKDNLAAMLKVYVCDEDTKIAGNKDISVDYGSGSYFTVRVVTVDGHAVGAGESVTFSVNGKNTTVTTDANGIAKVKINEVPGTYVVKTTYNGKTYQNNVAVKLNLKTCKGTGNKNIKVDYSGGKYFTVKVVSADGKVAAKGASVIFTINKITKTVTTDKNGIARIKITDAPGTYTIKTVFNAKIYTNKVTVKHVLKTKKFKVKKKYRKFTLKATLKVNGKLVKGKKITFKFKGKTYKAKTNKKGIAKVTIKKKVIRKLKRGKTYTVKVTYGKDKIKTTVKVR